MFYFVYCTDRPGSGPLRERLVEEHWAYMDRFAAELYARGPTLSPDGETATGSLHVVDLPSDAAAESFALLEPNWLAGVYESVVVYRFEDLLGRSMWDFTGPEGARFLVVAPEKPGTPGTRDVPMAEQDLIVLGRLRSLGDGAVVGIGACVQAVDAAAVAEMFSGGVVRPWRFGGRPAN
ncbi:YciI family protein [Dactylosporangium sp. CS-047395]|uniref:YciI family protein n=1 Tax=Dactylosporangium sp. CS-047395 TaxID=3239936 RepID=UPI003D8E66DB